MHSAEGGASSADGAAGSAQGVVRSRFFANTTAAPELAAPLSAVDDGTILMLEDLRDFYARQARRAGKRKARE